MTSTSTPEKGTATASASAMQDTAAPASGTASTAAPAATSKSEPKSLEEKRQAMLSAQQKGTGGGDPGMSYTRMVLEAARQYDNPPAGSEGQDLNELKKKQRSAICADQSPTIEHGRLAGTSAGRLLNPGYFAGPDWEKLTFRINREGMRVLCQTPKSWVSIRWSIFWKGHGMLLERRS